MDAGPSRLSYGIRSGAAVTLLAWVFGLYICISDCATAKLPVESPKPMASACTGHCGSSNSQPAEKPGSCCCSLQLVTLDFKSAAVFPPEGVAWVLPAADVPVPALELAGNDLRCRRRLSFRAWVFVPEVSLGPAFRAHAPPISL